MTKAYLEDTEMNDSVYLQSEDERSDDEKYQGFDEMDFEL